MTRRCCDRQHRTIANVARIGCSGTLWGASVDMSIEATETKKPARFLLCRSRQDWKRTGAFRWFIGVGCI